MKQKIASIMFNSTHGSSQEFDKPCRPKIPASLTALLSLSASHLEALQGELVPNNHLGWC